MSVHRWPNVIYRYYLHGSVHTIDEKLHVKETLYSFDEATGISKRISGLVEEAKKEISEWPVFKGK